jgi:hypothetical protein
MRTPTASRTGGARVAFVTRRAWLAVAALGLLVVSVDGPAGATVPTSVVVSDTSPGVSPTVTFTYTLTRDRTEVSGANFFYMFKPVGFPDLAEKNCTEIKALTTVKVNGATQNNDDLIDTGVCLAWSGGVQLRLKTGATLLAGDVIEVILAPGVLTNSDSASTTTWTWRTSDAGGNNADNFSATLVTGETTIPTTTTTTEPTTTDPTDSGSESTDLDASTGGGSLGDSGARSGPLVALGMALVLVGAVARLTHRRDSAEPLI